MIRLDHFVIHVDPDMRRLLELKGTLAGMGYPFEPTWGKGTRSFQVANLWIGNQYLEMVWLKRSDCRDWVPEWVHKYNQGHRGITAIMLLTDELERIRTDLLARGLRVSPPERTSFRFFFGLLRKTLPWRYVLLEPIPGTDLQVGFIELDGPQVLQQLKAYMIPNAAERGIDGIGTAIVRGPFSDAAWSFWKSVFPQAVSTADRIDVDLAENTRLVVERGPSSGIELELHANSKRPELVGQGCQIGNVRLVTVSDRRLDEGVDSRP